MKMNFLLAAGLLGLAAPSHAQTPVTVEATGVATETINFGDLNLTSESGQARLESRIKAAAALVCMNSIPEPLIANLESLNCQRHAMDGAYKQMDRFLLAKSAGAPIAVASAVNSSK